MSEKISQQEFNSRIEKCAREVMKAGEGMSSAHMDELSIRYATEEGLMLPDQSAARALIRDAIVFRVIDLIRNSSVIAEGKTTKLTSSVMILIHRAWNEFERAQSLEEVLQS